MSNPISDRDKLHVALDGIVKPVTIGFGFARQLLEHTLKAKRYSQLLAYFGMSVTQICVVALALAVTRTPHDLERHQISV